MGGTFGVEHVDVHNRRDCCADELGHYLVWVSSTADFRHTGMPCVNATLPTTQATTHLDTHLSAACGATGRFVTLLLPGEARLLHIEEFEVFGTPAPSPPFPSAPPSPPDTPPPTVPPPILGGGRKRRSEEGEG